MPSAGKAPPSRSLALWVHVAPIMAAAALRRWRRLGSLSGRACVCACMCVRAVVHTRWPPAPPPALSPRVSPLLPTLFAPREFSPLDFHKNLAVISIARGATAESPRLQSVSRRRPHVRSRTPTLNLDGVSRTHAQRNPILGRVPTHCARAIASHQRRAPLLDPHEQVTRQLPQVHVRAQAPFAHPAYTRIKAHLRCMHALDLAVTRALA